MSIANQIQAAKVEMIAELKRITACFQIEHDRVKGECGEVINDINNRKSIRICFHGEKVRVQYNGVTVDTDWAESWGVKLNQLQEALDELKALTKPVIHDLVEGLMRGDDCYDLNY